jgi:RES domain-containing protein
MTLDPAALPDNWRGQPDATQTLGTQWLAEWQSALLWVPSAVMPHTSNVLINPLHPDALSLTIVSAQHYPFDDRLLKRA